jgi:hypothetical protein
MDLRLKQDFEQWHKCWSDAVLVLGVEISSRLSTAVGVRIPAMQLVWAAQWMHGCNSVACRIPLPLQSVTGSGPVLQAAALAHW